MLTPNLIIKLVSSFFLVFGILGVIFFNNFNKLLGLIMILYSFINLKGLQRKGDKKYKLNLLKINIVLLSAILIAYSVYLINKNIVDCKILVIPILTLIIIANYISIRIYKM